MIENPLSILTGDHFDEALDLCDYPEPEEYKNFWAVKVEFLEFISKKPVVVYICFNPVEGTESCGYEDLTPRLLAE